MGKSILWGLIAMFSFFGAIGFGVSIAVNNENTHPFLYLGLALCLVAMVFFGDKSAKAFEIWQAKLVQDIIDGESEMVHWEYTSEEWIPFAKSYYEKSRKLAKWIFGFLFACLAIVVLAGIFTAENVNGFKIEISIGAVASFLGGLWWVTNAHYRRVKSAYFKSDNPEVHIGKKGMVINKEFLVVFSRKNASLSAVEVVEKYNTNCICFQVKTQTSEGASEQKHYVPIPNGKQDEVIAIRQLLLQD